MNDFTLEELEAAKESMENRLERLLDGEEPMFVPDESSVVEGIIAKFNKLIEEKTNET